MNRYICIHGHFYQPPRENPWLEAIEIQDSAYPYHDWNERITTECYGPNATARILGEDGYIERIVNNYAKISFNIGPTLLSWMEQKSPDVYQAILEADRLSMQHFSGHGSAIAQVYNHMIMPLANTRDKATQVRWGVRDFERRFRRKPEGMWLAETAVDTPTLEALAAEDIKFTVLAPYQASKVRHFGDGDWHDVSGGRIDTSRAYLAKLPSGRTIHLFFYHGDISRAVAFERLLSSGEHFAHRLTGAFGPEGGLVHIATDGETYGHHHRHGEMALAYALHYIEREQLATLTNYGEFLERYPAVYEVEIAENTAWSCAHGVERWRSDCGCNSGGHPGWNQRWRGPLRAALDWLRDETTAQFQKRAPALFHHPENARNDYIDVILDRSPENVQAFLRAHARSPLSPNQANEALKLLEIQRNAMLMYTSCGWFFDELSGIETSQILQYAGRVIQLAEDIEDIDLESGFTERLREAKSNLPAYGDGANIYDKFVRPARVDFSKLVAHYAVNSLFEEGTEGRHKQVYAFEIEEQDYHCFKSGNMRLLLGRVEVKSKITWGSGILSFGILHLGDHNLSGGVRAFQGEAAYQTMYEEVKDAFLRSEITSVFRLLDKHFLELTYSLRTLFRDQQRKVLQEVLDTALNEAQGLANRLYQEHTPLLRYLTALKFPLPPTLQNMVEFVLVTKLRESFDRQPLPLHDIRMYLAEAAAIEVELETDGLGFTFERNVESLARQWERSPLDMGKMQRLFEAASLLEDLPFGVDLYQVQNIFYKLLRKLYPIQQTAEASGDEAAAAWLALFRQLAEALRIRLTQ